MFQDITDAISFIATDFLILDPAGNTMTKAGLYKIASSDPIQINCLNSVLAKSTNN